MQYIYTDGGYKSNRGSWACRIIYENSIEDFSGGVKHTTSMRMELLAIIQALKIAQHVPTLLYTDCLNCVTNISRNNIRKGQSDCDLYEEALELVLPFPSIDFQWIPTRSRDIHHRSVDRMCKALL